MKTTEFTAQDCKQARQGLDWSRDRLAEASRVGKRTILDFENGVRQPVLSTKDALREALESVGVRFHRYRITIPRNNLKKGAEE